MGSFEILSFATSCIKPYINIIKCIICNENKINLWCIPISYKIPILSIFKVNLDTYPVFGHLIFTH